MTTREFPLVIGTVECPGCGYVADLRSSDLLTDLWTQLSGFLRCNGCPMCPADLRLTSTGFVESPGPTGVLH